MRLSSRLPIKMGPRNVSAVALPVNTVAPSISGTPTEGQTLTGSDGTWTLSPTLTRQWLRNGSTISGATASTYLLVTADVGATITLRVIANGTVIAVSAGVGPVAAAGTGTALSASELTRTSGPTTYPPTAEFTRPIDWADTPTMYGVMQRSQDATFATGVTEKELQITAAVTSYDFDLDTIASGVWYFRLGAYTGTRPGSLNWSNIAGVGDAVAPTITSDATPDGFQYVGDTLDITADKPGYLAIVGGADQGQFTPDGDDLNYATQTVAGTLTVQIQWTSYHQVASAVQNLVLTIAANSADAFVFTDVTGATQSTVYTSNTITVAGIDGTGITNPVTITGGEYSKNGGAYTSAATTAVNGDTFAVRQTSSASFSTAGNVVLTIGTTSDTYTVTTMANPAQASFSLEYDSGELSGGFAPSITQTGVTLAAGEYDFIVFHGTRKFDTLTWNGNSATLVVRTVETNEGPASITVFRLTVATGGTGSIVATSGFCNIVRIVILEKTTSAVSPSSTSKLHSSGFNTVHTPTTAITIPAGDGAAYSAIVHNAFSTGTVTWDAGTELLDSATANLGVSIVTNASTQPTATVSAGGAERAMVALAYDGA